ncbi:glycosyltransferase family 39 protein [Candidatus Microgenomates bacterium]|nr:glycosyltransferase family 39 protein [Candidatus Microgenomates bacterium]
MSIFFKYKFVILAGSAIILLYFFLRIVNLTILPVFVDEAIYIRWAQVMRNEPTLRFLPLSDGKQPLFMWSIIPLFKLFSDPLVAGRMVSVAAGFATLIGIFALTLYLFRSRKTALVASLIYAISPFTVLFDRMALVDSMLAMFGVWTLFFGILTVRTLRLDFAMLAGFALGGALITKSPALFFSLLLPVSLLLAKWPKKNSQRLYQLIKIILLFIVIYGLAYGIYNILRLGPNFNLIATRNQDYVLPLSHLWTNSLDPFMPHIDRAKEWLWILGPNIFLIGVLFGILIGLKNNLRKTLLVVLWAAVPIVVQAEFAKVFTARYMFFSLPFLAILTAIPFLVKNKIAKFLSLAALLIFIGQALWINYRLVTNPETAPLPQSERSGYLEEWTAGTGIREIADFIKSKPIEPGKKIIIGTEGYFGTLPDGLQIYLEKFPQIVVIGVGISITEVPEQLKNAKKAGDKVYLVANSSRMLEKFEIDATQAAKKAEKLGLAVVSSYPKAKRARTDTHQYLFYGERDYLYLFEVTERALNSQNED